MPNTQHSAITGADAIHPSDYYQSADPGAVGPNKRWTDTTSTPPVQRRRNAADNGWDTIHDPLLYQVKSLLTTLGDIIYASAANSWARLGGNTTGTKKFLRQTGTGTVSSAPAWDILFANDIPSLDASKIATGILAPALLPGLDNTYYQSHVNSVGLDIWYPLGFTNTQGSATGTPGANTLTAVPFIAPARGPTLDRIAFSVQTAVAGNARVGLYDSVGPSNMYPGSLILDGGGISTGTTGSKSAIVSRALVGGKLYYVVYLSDAGASCRVPTAGQGNCVLGVDSSLPGAPNRGLTVAQTYGALPGTFPAGAVTIISSIIPIVYGRYSA